MEQVLRLSLVRCPVGLTKNIKKSTGTSPRIGRLTPGQGIPSTNAVPPHSHGLRPRALASRAVQIATNGTRKTRSRSVVSSPKISPCLRNPGIARSGHLGIAWIQSEGAISIAHLALLCMLEYTRICCRRQCQNEKPTVQGHLISSLTSVPSKYVTHSRQPRQFPLRTSDTCPLATSRLIR